MAIEYTTTENLEKAARLAKWLIEEKKVDRKKAYIIAQRKYNILTYSLVRAAYQKLKPKQMELI